MRDKPKEEQMQTSFVAGGIRRWKEAPASLTDVPVKTLTMRDAVGATIRETRQVRGKTLRDVSISARVSLGYLSEVERGQKEASSEILAAICQSLDVPLSKLLRAVSNKLALNEELMLVPDTIPSGMVAEVLAAKR